LSPAISRSKSGNGLLMGRPGVQGRGRRECFARFQQ
jgi:hypothetical protein